MFYVLHEYYYIYYINVKSHHLLPDPTDMNDIAPDHPARHNARGSQSYSRKRALPRDEQLPPPIRALQRAPAPALAPRAAN